MNESNKNLLDEVVARQLRGLDKSGLSEEEISQRTKSVAELISKSIEIDKLEAQKEENERQSEIAFQRNDMEAKKNIDAVISAEAHEKNVSRDRWTKIGLALFNGALIVAGALFTTKFEYADNEQYTTFAGKWFERKWFDNKRDI